MILKEVYTLAKPITYECFYWDGDNPQEIFNFFPFGELKEITYNNEGKWFTLSLCSRVEWINLQLGDCLVKSSDSKYLRMTSKEFAAKYYAIGSEI